MTNLFLHCQFCSLLLSEKCSFCFCAWYPICVSCVWLFATPWTASHQAPLSLGILQAGILAWVAIPSSRGSSQPRDPTCVSHIYVHWQAGPLVSPEKPSSILIYHLLSISLRIFSSFSFNCPLSNHWEPWGQQVLMSSCNWKKTQIT